MGLLIAGGRMTNEWVSVRLAPWKTLDRVDHWTTDDVKKLAADARRMEREGNTELAASLRKSSRRVRYLLAKAKRGNG